MSEQTTRYRLLWRCLSWLACAIAMGIGFTMAAPSGALLAGAGLGMIPNIALPWEFVWPK